jgi:predicted aspartyl protease
MEIDTMGKVVVAARIENLGDVYEVEKRRLSASEVRSIDVADALADTGATMLSLPRKLIEQLGLRRVRTHMAQTATGTRSFGIHEAVRLTVQERDCVIEVSEIPDGCPVLIGQVPLELLDFVVDPKGRRLVGNPAHGGQRMIELF